MGVSKNRGTWKWMVKIVENPIKIDDLGGPPLFLETPICVYIYTYIYISVYIYEFPSTRNAKPRSF